MQQPASVQFLVSNKRIIGGDKLYNGSANTIDYINIATGGTAVDFGDLTVAGHGGKGGCNSLMVMVGCKNRSLVLY